MAHLGKISYAPGIDRVCGYWTWTWKLLIGDLKGSRFIYYGLASHPKKKNPENSLHFNIKFPET